MRDDYPDYIESIIDDAYHIVDGVVPDLNPDEFVEYVYSFTDKEIAELGARRIAEAFIDFISI